MLTVKQIDAAQPRIKPYKMSDALGLYVEVMPSGAKYWRLKYRFAGREKRLAIGVYPQVRLAEARSQAQAARDQLRAGIDPSAKKKAERLALLVAGANTFESVAREWLDSRKSTIEPAQIAKTLSRFEKDVFPWLGRRPMTEIEAPEILLILRRIDSRGARYTAHRVRSEISRVFRYGMATGRNKADPANALIGAIPPPVEKHMPSITEPDKVGEMLRAFDGFAGTFQVLCALKLSPLLFVRPGELRKAEWSAIDLDKGEWRYRVSKTKTDHLVPLSRQAVGILRELKELTGAGRYVFPGARGSDRPMSDAAVNAALRRIGYDTRTEITGHGFRAMARTILHEELEQKPEVIEHQLAHAVPDTLGTAYNRTKFLKERRSMMQTWADYLDRIKAGAQVIALKGRKR